METEAGVGEWRVRAGGAGKILIGPIGPVGPIIGLIGFIGPISLIGPVSLELSARPISPPLSR